MLERDFMKPGRSVALAENAMAATSHPQATLAALDILRAGGNAVDAAIAAVALQGVVDPHMTGIGGDCFALFTPAGGKPIALNGSGRAPAAAHPEFFREQGITGISDLSVHSVTVPGAVGAWDYLSATFGKIGLDAILQPAIRAARDGFTVAPRVARDWARYSNRLRRHEPAARQFLPAGRAPVTGDRLRNPALAHTLERIAREGRKAFYEGAVAEDIVATLNALGGLHTLADFERARPETVEPIGADYRGHRLMECPPNGQGLAALLMTRILEGFDLREGKVSLADRIHLLAEAAKSAYRQRDIYIADPDAMMVSVDDLLDEKRISAIRAAISLDRASPAEALDMPVHKDTVYVSVVDRDGNAISLINSIFASFGSGIYAEGAGVLLQNRGSGFSLADGHANCIGPSKRPFHTIIPAMLFSKGRPFISFGVMGGQYQANGHAHFISQVIDRGFDVQMASDQPRSFFTEGAISLEPTISDDVRSDLERRGHRTRIADEPLGGCQAIMIDHERGILWGASDHRKDGIALGY
ncbi:gamma-glutamyltransferase [Martelella sp. FOR1707]